MVAQAETHHLLSGSDAPCPPWHQGIGTQRPLWLSGHIRPRALGTASPFLPWSRGSVKIMTQLLEDGSSAKSDFKITRRQSEIGMKTLAGTGQHSEVRNI